MTTGPRTIDVPVRLPIKLGQFVKLSGLAETGGMAREAIDAGEVTVNGTALAHRGHHLAAGDVVQLAGAAPAMRVVDAASL